MPLFLWKIAEKSGILSYVKRNYADSRIIVVAERKNVNVKEEWNMRCWLYEREAL